MRLTAITKALFTTTFLVSGLSLAAPVLAEPVTLTSEDGALMITGDLLSYEDGFFRISTTIGELSINAADVTCEGDTCPVFDVGGSIVVAGASSIGSLLMPALLEGYSASIEAKLNTVAGTSPDTISQDIVADGGRGETLASVTINLSDSANAFRALTQPDVQIGLSTRRVLPAEARRVTQSRGGNLIDASQERVVAVDPVIIMVHPSNPVQALSIEQLDGIYSGTINNWSELGGRNVPIIVYGRDQSSGTGGAFQQSIFATSGNRQAGSVIVLDSDEQIAQSVMTQPTAIGISGVAFAGGTKSLDIIDQCGISVSPNSFNTKAEEYPIQRRLYLYNRADNMTDTLAGFLDFASSNAADALISSAGFFNLSVEQDQRPYQGGRAFSVIDATSNPDELPLMRELVVDLLSYDRLTTTIRFGSGSSSLDAKGFSDLDRMFQYLNTLDYPVELLFVGFSDADGSFDANSSLSLNRANQVADSAAQFAAGKITNPYGVSIGAKGFGELAPVACNATLEGKRTNRRVEIWIRRQ
ncbi:MAG: OmpA family protein [Rhodobacteraceae bacterium]|nr:OmpA family protein [Paracoccaceae bacterium]